MCRLKQTLHSPSCSWLRCFGTAIEILTKTVPWPSWAVSPQKQSSSMGRKVPCSACDRQNTLTGRAARPHNPFNSPSGPDTTWFETSPIPLPNSLSRGAFKGKDCFPSLQGSSLEGTGKSTSRIRGKFCWNLCQWIPSPAQGHLGLESQQLLNSLCGPVFQVSLSTWTQVDSHQRASKVALQVRTHDHSHGRQKQRPNTSKSDKRNSMGPSHPCKAVLLPNGWSKKRSIGCSRKHKGATDLPPHLTL